MQEYKEYKLPVRTIKSPVTKEHIIKFLENTGKIDLEETKPTDATSITITINENTRIQLLSGGMYILSGEDGSMIRYGSIIKVTEEEDTIRFYFDGLMFWVKL